eukprot:gene7636-9140_t
MQPSKMQPIKLPTPFPQFEKFDASDLNTTSKIAGVDFVNRWSLADALRELLSNTVDQGKIVAEEYIGRDAPVDFKEERGCFLVSSGEKLLAKVTFKKEKAEFVTSYHWVKGAYKARVKPDAKISVNTCVLELVSYASKLHFKFLDIGETTKKGNLSMIGTHGEGLSGACVILAREGHNLSIECGYYKYRARIVNKDGTVYRQMERNDSKVLGDETVRIRIVFNPEWSYPLNLPALVRSVRLSPADVDAAVATDYGHVLVAPHMRGKIFVKEMFVTTDANCLFGYNFNDPEKTLLQDRDRKACEQNEFSTTSALSISQAAPKRYKDLMSDVPLTALAIDALRRHCEATRVPEGQKAMFLSVDSPELKEIRRLLNLVPMFCLPALHNHATIVRDFKAMLARDAQELDPTTRVGALKEPLRELLNVREVKQTGNADTDVGIWLADGVAYMTGVYSLGSAEAIGFTRFQLRSILDSLHFANIDSQTIVDIMELLRKQPMPEPLPEPVPPPSPVYCEAALEEKEGELLQDRAAEQVMQVMDEEEMAMETGDQRNGDPAAVLSGQIHGSQALPPLERLHVTSGAAIAALLVNEPAAQDEISMRENEASGKASFDSASSSASVVSASVEYKDGADAGALTLRETGTDEEVEGDWYCGSQSDVEDEDSELESEGHVDDGAEHSDATELSSDHSDYSDSFDGPKVYVNDDERADQPPPKRLKRARADTTGAPTAAAAAAVCAAPPPPPHLPLDPPLQTISLSTVHGSVVHQLSFRDEFGMWLYSDDATIEQAMVQQLEACVPTLEYRVKLRKLSALVHIVVFVTTDEQAPLGINVGPHIMCINLGDCVTEKSFRYCVDAQLSVLGLMK